MEGTIGRAAGVGRARPGLGLTLLCSAQFLLILDVAVVNVALPSVQDDLGLSGVALQSVVSAYTLAFGALLLLGGRAADRLGRRRVFVAGLTVFVVGSVLYGAAGSGSVLVAARAVQGVGAALVSPAALALLPALYPEPRARTRALGIWSALAAAGGAAGLVLGGLLTGAVGWRAVFLVNVVGLVAVVAAPRVLPEPTRPAGGPVDAAGGLLATLGSLALVVGVTEGGRAGFGSPAAVALLAGAALALLGLVVVEARARDPLVPAALLRSRPAVGADLTAFLVSPVVVGVNFFLTLHLQRVLGLSPWGTGLAFLPLTVISAATSLAAPAAVARWGARTVLTAAVLLLAAGTALLVPITPQSGYPAGVLPGLVLVALGLGPVFTVTAVVATAGVPDAQQGAAAGVLSTAQQLGGSLGLAVLAVVATTSADRGPGGDALTDGAGAAFAVMTGLGLVAAAVAATTAGRGVPGGRPPPVPVPATVAASTLPGRPGALVGAGGTATDPPPHRPAHPAPPATAEPAPEEERP